MGTHYAKYGGLGGGGGSVTTGNLTDVGTDGITITGGTNAVVGSGTQIAQHVADASHNGYLSSTDWSTFNSKQAAISIGAFGSSPNANGLDLTAGTLTLEPADGTHPGAVSIAAQTFAGVKTFSSAPNFSSLTASRALVLDASKNVTTLLYTSSNNGSSLAYRDSNGNSTFNRVDGTTTAVSATGQTINMNAGSSQIQKITGSGNVTFNLPDATNLISGSSYYFNNNSTGTVTINNNGGTLIETVPAGGYAEIVCTDNSTINGAWDYHNFWAFGTVSGTAGTTMVGYLTVPGQITSQVTTGTAPFVVSSTTQVANLNAATAGTATTATNANNVATTQVSNNASYYPLMVASSTNSNQACDLGTGLTFNPSTNTLATTTFSGAFSGTATNATNVATTQVSNSASYYPLMVASSTNGNQACDLGTGLTFNPSTNTMSTTTFVGALTGTASGNTTYTANNHGVVVSGSGNAMTVIAPNASTAFPLVSGGTGADPSWAALGVAGGGTGTTTQFTQGSVIFAGANGVYSQETTANSQLFWDDTNFRLGIGTNTPSIALHVTGPGGSSALHGIMVGAGGVVTWNAPSSGSDYTSYALYGSNTFTILNYPSGQSAFIRQANTTQWTFDSKGDFQSNIAGAYLIGNMNGRAPNYIANSNFQIDATSWTSFSCVQSATFTNTSANITVGSTTGMYVGQPVIFDITEGTTLTPSAGTGPSAAPSVLSQTFYIAAISSSTVFTVSNTLGGSAVTWTVGGSGGTQWVRPLTPTTYTGGTPFNFAFSQSASSPIRGQGQGLIKTVSSGSGAASVTFTVTIATPGVFTANGHGLSAGQMIWLHNNSDTLPTGLSFNTPYYVISTGLTTNTFQVSTSVGGSAVATSGSQAGTHKFYSEGCAAGNGVSYAFTLNTADEAKVMSVQFDFNADSNFSPANGTTAPNAGGAGDSDLEVYIWDVTNSAIIYCSPQVITANGSNNFTYKGTFQTASNSTSYALVIYQSKGELPATAANFKFTNVFVGPQAIVQGPPVTDWTAYTPTFSAGFGTVSGVTAYYKRVGDTLHVSGTFTTGTVAASVGSITLPSGLTMDTTKLAISNNTTSNVGVVLGSATLNKSSAYNTRYYNIVSAPGTSTSVVYISDNLGDSGGGFAIPIASVSGAADSNQAVVFFFSIPIAGWSSTTLMSNDTDTRVVTARASLSSNQTGANPNNNDVQVTYNSVTSTGDFDTHAAFNTSTSTYTVPVSGYYRITAQVQVASTNVLNNIYRLKIYQNQASTSIISELTPAVTTEFMLQGATVLKCAAGDTLKIYLFGAGNNSSSTLTINAGGGGDTSFCSFERLTGPSAIAASESVEMSYVGYSSGISGTSNATITYATKVRDTHNAYSAGTYTVPISGAYQVEAGLLLTTSGTPTVGTTIADLQIIQAGSASTTFENKYYVPTTNTTIASAGFPVSASGIMYCLAGDTIKVQASVNLGTAGAGASNTMNYFCLVRVGN